MELSKNTTEALKLMIQAGNLFQQERKESYLFITSTTNSATKTEEESQNKTGAFAFCMQFGGNPQEIAMALLGLMRKDPVLKMMFLSMLMADLSGSEDIMTKAVSVDSRQPAEAVVKSMEERAKTFGETIKSMNDEREAKEFQANPPTTKA